MSDETAAAEVRERYERMKNVPLEHQQVGYLREIANELTMLRGELRRWRTRQAGEPTE